MLKKSVRAAISVLLVCGLSSVGVGAAGAAKPTPKKFANCTALLKTYKNGVAATKSCICFTVRDIHSKATIFDNYWPFSIWI